VLYSYFSFFKLFNKFKGYVELFLLQDLATDDFSEIKFFIPFTLKTYMSYKDLSTEFLQDRNQLIKKSNQKII